MAAVPIEWKTEVWEVRLPEGVINLTNETEIFYHFITVSPLTCSTMGRWRVSVLVTMVTLPPVHLSACTEK